MQTPQLKKKKKTLSWLFQFRQSNPKGVPNFFSVQNDLQCPNASAPTAKYIRTLWSDLISSSCCLTDDWTDTERRSTVTDVTSDHCYIAAVYTGTQYFPCWELGKQNKKPTARTTRFPKLAVANQEGKEAVPPAVAWEEFSAVLYDRWRSFNKKSPQPASMLLYRLALHVYSRLL
jgi:hypothetical protein